MIRMDGDSEGREPAIQIGRTNTALGLLRVVAVVGGSVLLLWLGRLVGFEPGAWLMYPLFLALGTLYVIVVHRSSRLILDADGLAVITGRAVNRYRWDDLLEVGWANGDFPTVGCRPIVRPRGKPYAVPGPNQPKVLGTLAVFGRARSEARSAVRARHASDMASRSRTVTR
jgi:hypothetical protein